MTLDEARRHIGDVVVYYDGGLGSREDGTIVRVSQQFVFVRYDSGIQATLPEQLTLLEKEGR